MGKVVTSPAGFFFPFDTQAPSKETITKEIDGLRESMVKEGLSAEDAESLTQAVRSSNGFQPVMMALVTMADVAMSTEDMISSAAALVALVNVQRRIPIEHRDRRIPDELVQDYQLAVASMLADKPEKSEEMMRRMVEQGMPAEEVEFRVWQTGLLKTLEVQGVWYTGIQKACAAIQAALSEEPVGDLLARFDKEGMPITKTAEVLRLAIEVQQKTTKLDKMD